MKVIITSILFGFDQKKHFFSGELLVQVQYFGIGTRYDLDILHQCGKGLKSENFKG